MNVVTRGFRNAFRNATRTVSIVVILGLSTGLSLIMLIAHQAVQSKIKTTLGTIGNTVSISPAGYMPGSSVNNALSNSQLSKVQHVMHITKVTGILTDHLQTEGTISSLPGPAGAQAVSAGGSSSDASTNLKASVKLDDKGSAGGLFISGPSGAAPQLPSNFSPPIPITGTNNPTDPSAIDASSLKIVSGTAINGNKDSNDAMISTDMAGKNDLKVGSTFTAYGKVFKVAAIFDTGNAAGNDNIIVSLPTEQRLSGQKNAVTGLTATVDSLNNLSTVTTSIKKSLGASADVKSNLDQANEALQPLNSVKSVSLYSLIGSIVAGAVIILLTMIMIVRERRREIGILKAIGGSNIRIMLQFMSEALTLTLLGAIIGLLLGIIGGSPVTSTLVSNTNGSGGSVSGPGVGLHVAGPRFADIRNVHAQIGWTIILFGIGVAVLIALVGSAIASYVISKVRPAEVLRSE